MLIEILCNCGEDVSPGRSALGFHTCLDCGEVSARKVKLRNQRSVATLHKGNAVYLGSGPAAVQYARDIAAMRRGVHG